MTQQHLDQDSDDVFQARVELNAHGVAINTIISYLNNLFGATGEKASTIATLFSNQAVLFASGTRLIFVQATAPLGWFKVTMDYHRYLVVTPWDDGMQYFGNYSYAKYSTPTSLSQADLPAVWFNGSTDVQGDHYHIYTNTSANFSGGNVPVQRAENDYRAWVKYDSAGTNTVGAHAHNFSVHSGGQNLGHQHILDISDYRPAGITGIMCEKS